MATISQIANILEKAKHGQYIALKCEGQTSDIKARVVQLGTDNIQIVTAENWKEGWPEEPTPTELSALCFTAKEAGASVKLLAFEYQEQEEGSGQYVPVQIPSFCNFEYSTDNQNSWSSYDGRTVSLDDCTGGKVFFRADPESPNTDGLTEEFGLRFHQFVFTGAVAASGSIQYLLDADGRTDVPPFAFTELFSNATTLTTAPELPATTIGQSCYAAMFAGCTSLTAAPALPATTLASGCYQNMFNSCIALTAAPALPAETLTDSCYCNMFTNCTSLTVAPALPGTVLDTDCYSGMFLGCTSLTTAPSRLPAMTLAGGCYNSMFSDCTALTTAPELPATTLAVNCYASMFAGCTSLTAAPELPATTLASSCYDYMFFDCPKFQDCHMKTVMSDIYNDDIHGNTYKTVVFDLV